MCKFKKKTVYFLFVAAIGCSSPKPVVESTSKRVAETAQPAATQSSERSGKQTNDDEGEQLRDRISLLQSDPAVAGYPWIVDGLESCTEHFFYPDHVISHEAVVESASPNIGMKVDDMPLDVMKSKIEPLREKVRSSVADADDLSQLAFWYGQMYDATHQMSKMVNSELVTVNTASRHNPMTAKLAANKAVLDKKMLQIKQAQLDTLRQLYNEFPLYPDRDKVSYRIAWETQVLRGDEKEAVDKMPVTSETVEMYRKFVDEFPESDYAANAWMLIGENALIWLKELLVANQAYTNALFNAKPGSDVMTFAKIRIAELQVALGNYDYAQKQFALALDGEVSDLHRKLWCGAVVRAAEQIQGSYEHDVLVATEITAVSNGSNQLGGYILDNLYKTNKGNIVISPYGISTVLAIVLAGTTGETNAQIMKALRLNTEAIDVQGSFKHLLHDLVTVSNPSTVDRKTTDDTRAGWSLLIKNRFFASRDFNVRQQFQNQLREAHDVAEIALLNDSAVQRHVVRKLSNNPGVQRHAKKSWAEAKKSTNGTFLISNELEFHGRWAAQFSKHNTRKKPFFISETRKISVPMMTERGTYLHKEIENAQVLSVPFEYASDGHGAEFIVVLPNTIADTADVAAALNSPKIADILDMGRNSYDISLTLPKFKIDESYCVDDLLRKLGIEKMYQFSNDFSLINDLEASRIFTIIQAAGLEVDEEGARGYARTWGMGGRRGRSPDEPLKFVVDHPFFFVIKDDQSDAIIMMGYIENPK